MDGLVTSDRVVSITSWVVYLASGAGALIGLRSWNLAAFLASSTALLRHAVERRLDRRRHPPRDLAP